MSKKRKPPRRPKLPPPAPPDLDPETGLPAVGKGIPRDPDLERDRTLRRARAKHTHKLRDHR